MSALIVFQALAVGFGVGVLVMIFIHSVVMADD